MFKSVFTKYIFAFMLIIIVSFLLLGLIITSYATTYSRNMKQEKLQNAEAAVCSYITRSYQNDETQREFQTFMYYVSTDSDGDFPIMIRTIISAADSDIFIIVTDTSGKIMYLEATPEEVSASGIVSPSVISAVEGTDSYFTTTDLGGLLSGSRRISGGSIRSENGDIVGCLFVGSNTYSDTDFTSSMLKVIIVAILWVMVAALASVYFITDRIVSPLKQMSEAARSFSLGKFDVRVPVQGKDEVAQLATAFNNMATSLEKNEDMRRTFLANVSHDLRTPMTSILGFLESILSGAIPPDKVNFYLEKIQTEVKRLSRLVMSLLDISRMQAGDRKFVKTKFDICEMAREIIISFEQKLETKKLDVEFDCGHDNMFVTADRDAIYQVLYNLCDNAVKFSKEGGKYKLSIIEHDGKVFVSVYNEGEGILAEELPYVFERFYKSDKSRGLDKSGAGLGLYISKTIIDAHGEEIWVKSVHGEYCEFVFTLTPNHDAPSLKKKNSDDGMPGGASADKKTGT